MGREAGGEEEGGLLDRLQGASILGWDGMSGEPRRTELWGRREEASTRAPAEKPCTATWEGWSLQAGVRIRAKDREGLGRLCLYILRPPFAGERLEELSDGRVLYRFRKPMPDGATHAVMDPLEFLAKLAALVPPPRSHLVHYHGSLAISLGGMALIPSHIAELTRHRVLQGYDLEIRKSASPTTGFPEPEHPAVLFGVGHREAGPVEGPYAHLFEGRRGTDLLRLGLEEVTKRADTQATTGVSDRSIADGLEGQGLPRSAKAADQPGQDRGDRFASEDRQAEHQPHHQPGL